MIALAVLVLCFQHASEQLVWILSEDPCIILVGIVMFGYITRYFMKFVRRPEILVKHNSDFHHFLKKYCPIVDENFSPTIWCYGTVAQTVLSQFVQHFLVPEVNFRRELLELPDGGIIGLDYFGDADEDESDIIMIMCGLTGCSKAEYIRQFCLNIKESGRRAVVMNYRGKGGVVLKNCKTYCSTYPDDFEFALKHVRRENPDSRIMAVGVSFGGMLLTQYLDKAKDPIICAGMAISPAWNAHATSLSLEEPLNWFIFNRYLTGLLQESVNPYREMFQKADYDIDAIMNCRTIREFDTLFTSVVFGYKTNDDYYTAAAIDEKLDRIKIPMLYLNAADDVFCPRHTINDDFLCGSSNVACVVTEKGGHIGFMDGLFPGPNTYMHRLFTQYMNAIFEHGHELGKTAIMTDNEES